MIRYMGIGFLFSGILTLWAVLSGFEMTGGFLPDPVLLVIVVAGIRGTAGSLVPLCLVLGFVQGVAGPLPAGFYILVYLFIGAFLLRTGSLFFTHHPLTQLFLAALMVGFYGLFLTAGQAVHLIPESTAGIRDQLLSNGISTVVLTPILLAVIQRFNPMKKKVRP